jgi:DNA-binding NarL/FixJ family response regulator
VPHELVRGNSVCDIAPRLAVSPHAVRACVQSLADKLGVRGQLRIAAVGRELLAAAQTSHDDPFTVAGGIRGA